MWVKMHLSSVLTVCVQCYMVCEKAAGVAHDRVGYTNSVFLCKVLVGLHMADIIVWAVSGNVVYTHSPFLDFRK